MKLSARHQIKGRIVNLRADAKSSGPPNPARSVAVAIDCTQIDRKGATTAHARVDIGGGVIMTSSITNEAVDELGLAAGQVVSAVVKASDVMIGVS